MNRPAEVATASGAVALILARLLHITDPTLTGELALALGAVPALVTFVATHGGIAGVARAVWRGVPVRRPGR
jgi:hypothetical protein